MQAPALANAIAQMMGRNRLRMISLQTQMQQYPNASGAPRRPSVHNPWYGDLFQWCVVDPGAPPGSRSAIVRGENRLEEMSMNAPITAKPTPPDRLRTLLAKPGFIVCRPFGMD